MKIGLRTPSVKKMAKARTAGKINRKLKSSVNPLYGKSGMGVVNDPKKAIYNKVYNQTTVSAKDIYNEVNEEPNINKVQYKRVKFNLFNLITGLLGIPTTILFFALDLKAFGVITLIIALFNIFGYIKYKM